MSPRVWRRLHAEWRGSAPQAVAAKARRFQDSACCADVQGFWDALPAWKQLGSEVALGGYAMPGWVRITALENLVSDSPLTQIMSRPALSDYTAKLLWVRA